MKDFLKKVFFFDRPAQGAFAGTTLLFVSLWLAPALYLLCEGLARPWGFRGNPQMLFLLLPVPAFFYWLILFFRFHRSEILRGKPKWNSPEMLFSLAVLIPTLALAPMVSSKFGFGYGFCLLLVIPVWIIPPASMPRQWKFWLVRGLCWTGFFFCLIRFLKSLQWTWNYMFFYGFSSNLVRYGKYSAAQDLLIVYLGVILLLAGYLLSAKMYAAAAGIYTRKIFGPLVKVTLGTAVAVYLVSCGMALVQHHNSERTATETGAFFGYPLNADGVNTLLRRNKWSDPPAAGLPNRYRNHPYLEEKDIILPKEVRRQWQAELEQIEPLKAWEREQAKPLQPGFRPAKDGDLWCLWTRVGLRQFCCLERWRIAFLLEKDDPAGALEALHRLENALEFFRRNPAQLYELAWLEGATRLDAMERLLSDGRVSDAELKRWTTDLERREKEIPELERLSIYVHAVLLNNKFYQFAHGKDSLPLYPLRWLCPPVWYYASRDRERCLKRYRHEKFRDFPIEAKPAPVPGVVSGYWYPPVLFWRDLTTTLTTRYRAMRALIEIELEKRLTGKYPDALKNPPIDPFTDKPMHYKKGKMPLIVKVWDPALGKLIPERREADGIAVWSLGRNRKNEWGLDQRTVRKYADDIRAKMIFKPETAN